MTFHLYSPEGVTGLMQPYWLKIANFSYPLSLSALTGGDPFQIHEKALRILKLESSRQPTVEIWWS